MDQIKVFGLDLAKNIFHAAGCNQAGKVLVRKVLKRHQLLNYFAQQPPILIGLESCATAHYWARELQALGHQVKMMAPQHVKAYLRGCKNDFNDAEAIAEAATREQVRPVAVKTPDQQALQALHKERELLIKERTALSNQIRGILAEFGLAFPKGYAHLRKTLAELTGAHETELPILIQRQMIRMSQRFEEVSQSIAGIDKELDQQAQSSPACCALTTIPGIGKLTASALYSSLGDASEFRRGRDFSASIGLVPKQHSSGGKSVLLGITKRGNSRLRYLLVHGARSVLRNAGGKSDPLSVWANRLKEKRGYNCAAVALANKIARIAWAVLHTGEPYNTAYYTA